MSNKIIGLSEEEVKKSRELYGDNKLKREKKKGFFKRYIENLSDTIIKILLFALAIQLVFTIGDVNYLEMGGIIVAILISSFVSTISEFRSEKAFDKLNSDATEGCFDVWRGGKVKKVSLSNIVIGDVVYLSSGEKIPADGEILQGKILVDQSALNGESAEIVKTVGSCGTWDLSSKNKIFRGTMITNGSCVYRVGRVGDSTYFGMVARDIQTQTRESPLKIRLGQLAKQISRIGYAIAFCVGIAYIFSEIVINNNFDLDKIALTISDAGVLFQHLVGALTLMTTVIVVAAPEGLPMMITVVLSANMKRMIKDKILVKKLVGIETAGSMNILFSDKTGTITYGKPRFHKIISIYGCINNIEDVNKLGSISKMLILNSRYNTDVIVEDGELVGGNFTDRVIFDLFKNEKTESFDVLSKRSFSSDLKYSSVTSKNGKTLIKGAAELILASCKYALDKDGKKIMFDKTFVFEEYLNSAECGERVVGVAFNDSDSLENMTFVGLIVMKDKVRDGVVKSVRDVIKAGIQVVMITGDGKETASAIASECGIFSLSHGHIALSSSELNKMSDNEIKKILHKLRVVSRALPQDKTRLVRISQELGLVVGMTGDGINDAPSLKLSDVGFAMGSGTDIAKSASDIVILNNSFTAISKTVLYGRTIFKSIRKFITFQLTMNLAACGVSLIGQFVGVDTPITIIQMLWINIIMDTLGGLAFSGEPPLDYYMNESPKSRNEAILSSEMLNQILLSGLYTLAICIMFLTSPVIRIMYGSLYPTEKFYTAFYALFIFFGIFNCICARSSRLWMFSNISKNKYFILIMILISFIQICMIYFGGELFRCVPLKIQELNFVVLMSMSVIPFEIIRRILYKLK